MILHDFRMLFGFVVAITTLEFSKNWKSLLTFFIALAQSPLYPDFTHVKYLHTRWHYHIFGSIILEFVYS